MYSICAWRRRRSHSYLRRRVRNNTQSGAFHCESSVFATIRALLEIRGQLQMDPTDIAGLIEAGLPQAEVKILSDDNTHFDALVVSEMFEDKRPIARHQMIYKCLGTLMGNEIHAMSIRAYTPDEWRDLATS